MKRLMTQIRNLAASYKLQAAGSASLAIEGALLMKALSSLKPVACGLKPSIERENFLIKYKAN
jgi:hypothetical protein